MTTIDWEVLKKSAISAMEKAYAPYSKFPVGVAAQVDDGRMIIRAIYCVDAHGNALSPCGRCRQLLWEHSTPDTQFMTPDGPAPLSSLLPWAFGPENL